MCGRAFFPIGQEPAPPPNNDTVHPILGVLPAYREPGNKVTYFAEKCRAGCFWAERLSRTYRRATPDWERNYKHHFSFDNGRVCLYSNYPWPDNAALGGEAALCEAQLPGNARKYVRLPPPPILTLEVTLTTIHHLVCCRSGHIKSKLSLVCGCQIPTISILEVTLKTTHWPGQCGPHRESPRELFHLPPNSPYNHRWPMIGHN
jgi:hypothetical protein